MMAEEALRSVEDNVKRLGDEKVVGSYYLEFGRRLEVLRLVEKYCEPGATLLDLGAQPFIMSCALKRMGYNVVAIDVEPEPYLSIAESCGVDVVKCDLERGELKVADADCAVFTEVLEHLHYYYVPSVLEKINRALKRKGYLILTTPNIASLFRRLKLLLGKQPIYRHHVREYTMEEVLELIKGAGFDVVESYYSHINDLTYIYADQEDYLSINGYKDLIRITLKRPTKVNILRTLAYPLIKLKPSLGQLIVIVSIKIKEPKAKIIERW
jgi:2-polyprenyl-3-methyl-5-hydroxy-6-metoxy-1,4-benzoquinol methylase